MIGAESLLNMVCTDAIEGWGDGSCESDGSFFPYNYEVLEGGDGRLYDVE
jgi:hypothetical protein